jgi:hypothetical protein
MMRHPAVARVTRAADGLERIVQLEWQLASAPINSHRRRTLKVAIRLEAAAYRKSLDTEQAAARRKATLQPTAGRGPRNHTAAARKPTLVSRGRIHRRRPSPRH